MNYKNNTFVVCAIPWFVPSQNCLFSAWLDKDSFLGNERTGASPQLDERAGMWMRIAAFSSHVIQGLNLPAPTPSYPTTSICDGNVSSRELPAIIVDLFLLQQ